MVQGFYVCERGIGNCSVVGHRNDVLGNGVRCVVAEDSQFLIVSCLDGNVAVGISTSNIVAFIICVFACFICAIVVVVDVIVVIVLVIVGWCVVGAVSVVACCSGGVIVVIDCLDRRGCGSCVVKCECRESAGDMKQVAQLIGEFIQGC